MDVNTISWHLKYKFIVFEGLDGSGKGTQIKILADKLSSLGCDKVFLTCEPTKYATGKILRDALSGQEKRTPEELAGLFLADRIAHCENPSDGIKAMLQSGAAVICDRYYYSSFAYQGMDTDLKWVMDANLCCPKIIKPDVCIFLDVPPQVSDERIASRNNPREIYEQADKIARIRQKYMDVFELLPDHNIKIINASGDVNEVSKRISDALGIG